MEREEASYSVMAQESLFSLESTKMNSEEDEQIIKRLKALDEGSDSDEEQKISIGASSKLPPPTSITMEEIIDLQSINGSWSMTKTLTHLIKLSGKDIYATPPDSFGDSLKSSDRILAWATVLALWLLETFCAGQKNEWKRIAAKGNKFLKELGITLKEALSLI